MSPLQILPLLRCPVPRGALRHPFLLEAGAVLQVLRGSKTSNGGVIGTNNTRRAELYGWHNPVSPHIDNATADRWVYGLLLKGPCEVWCIDPGTGSRYSVALRPGDMFRLNDRLPHWTAGKGSSLCIFAGCWEAPDDIAAATILSRGLRRLAKGVRTAPRVGTGFRVPGRDECWATNDYRDAHIVSRKLAGRRGWEIQTCWICDRPAKQLDGHWPFFSDANRCDQHMHSDGPTTHPAEEEA